MMALNNGKYGIVTGSSLRRPSGFSLIELMIVLVIFGIIATRAIPSFHLLMQSVQMNAAISAMERSLRYARHMAIIHNAKVNLCPSRDLKSCTDDNRWNYGWIIYTDSTGDRTFQSGDTLHKVIKRHSPVAITHNRGGIIEINPLGRIVLNGSVEFCGNSVAALNAGIAARIVMIHSGRLRLDKGGTICR